MVTLTRPTPSLLISQLPADYRTFVYRCHRLWFGEMRGVRIKNGVVASIQKCIRHHKPNRPQSERDPLGKIIPDAFKHCFAIWKEEQIRYVDLIKVENGLPVWTAMDEGAWTNNAVK